MDETIIYNYLSGLATNEEQRRLLDWLKASPENQHTFFEMKVLWKARHCMVSEAEEEQLLKASLTVLNQRIDRFVPFKTKTGSNYLWIQRCSAVAVVMLMLFFSFTFLYNKKETPSPSEIVYVNLSPDSVKKVILPDGTQVWLNTDARLVYSFVPDENQRLARLEGEAFFEVARDTLRPFIVVTNTLLTKVVGTSFCINTGLSDGVSRITLQTGSVQLLQTNGEKLAFLYPGQQAVYSGQTNSMEVREVNVEEYTSWRFDLIVLSNVDVSSIVNRIECLYHTKVKMDTLQLKGRKYNFSFRKGQGARQALRRLSYMTGIPVDTIR